MISASHRSEGDDQQSIQSLDTLSARLFTRLRKHLDLSSEITYSDREDPVQGFTLSTWSLKESIEATPYDRWTVGGGVILSWYDAIGSISLTKREAIHFNTSWTITRILVFTGFWTLGADDDNRSTTSNYSFSWIPSRKVTASIAHMNSETIGSTRTTSDAASMSYRMNRRFSFFGNLSRSSTERLGVVSQDITSVNAGFTLAL